MCVCMYVCMYMFFIIYVYTYIIKQKLLHGGHLTVCFKYSCRSVSLRYHCWIPRNGITLHFIKVYCKLRSCHVQNL